MNGRIYDPKLGRMLSPDPVTQAPENGQNYNRYSYAYNNPLKYTDPSGFNNCELGSCENEAGTVDLAAGKHNSSAARRQAGIDKRNVRFLMWKQGLRADGRPLPGGIGQGRWLLEKFFAAFGLKQQGGDVTSPDGNPAELNQVTGSLHDELIEKAKNGDSVCGPTSCIIYGTTQVVRPGSNSKKVWHEIPEEEWVSVWPIIPGRKPVPTIETATQREILQRT